MKGEMKVPKDFYRVDPGFHLSAFVAEQTGTHTDQRQKFPRTGGAGELEGWQRLFVGSCNRRDIQRCQQHDASYNADMTGNFARDFHSSQEYVNPNSDSNSK